MENFKISLSGIRGIIGENLFRDTIFDLASAFSKFSRGKILIGRDTRPSGRQFSQTAIKAVKTTGRKAIDLGILPTPTVLLLVKKMRAAGGMIITASHNPSNWNGLKLVNSQGSFLNSRDLRRFLGHFEKLKKEQGHKKEKLPLSKHVKFCGTKAIDTHIQTVLKHIDCQVIKKKGFRVGIDPINGAGAVISRKFLEKLNCRVFSINENPNGRFGRGPEPLPQNLMELSQLVKKHNLDLAFAQDPDADRLAIVSERGIPIGEEYSLALAFQGWLNRFEERRLQGKRTVVINLATSQMVEDMARKSDWKVWRTRVGEVNVVEKMKETGASFGGEGNGGVICPLINWGRDSFAGMGLILELAASSRKTIHQLTGELPGYYRFNDKVKISSSRGGEVFKVFKKKLKGQLKNCKVNFSDGIRAEGNKFWWLVRLSNTEPVIRIMGEAQTTHKAKALLSSLKRRLREADEDMG